MCQIFSIPLIFFYVSFLDSESLYEFRPDNKLTFHYLNIGGFLNIAFLSVDLLTSHALW